MAEESSRQPHIGRVMWLLMITLMRIYSEKEAKKDTENTEGKMNTRKFNAGAMVWAKRDKEK